MNLCRKKYRMVSHGAVYVGQIQGMTASVEVRTTPITSGEPVVTYWLRKKNSQLRLGVEARA